VSCELNDEVVILSLERSLYFGLQGAGVRIWQALEQPKSVAELCVSVADTYEVTPSDCERDIRQVLSNLEKEGLVVVAN
jgi:hypothetical protein